MKERMEEVIEDYLDGLLSGPAAVRLERDLLKPDVAAAFNEALLLRELLNNLPPDEPPPGLSRRIEAAMRLQANRSGFLSKPKQKTTLGRILDGLGWGVRWPGYTLAAVSPGSAAIKEMGQSAVDFSLGPLKAPAKRGFKTIGRIQKPIWKAAFSKVWSKVL